MWFNINTELKYNYERRMRLKNEGLRNTDNRFNGSFYVDDLVTRTLWDRLILFNM